MRTLMVIFSALLIPIIILLCAADIISGIWLAVLGEWRVIGIGLGILLVSAMPLGFAMMPGGLLFGVPAMRCAEAGRRLGLYVFGFLSSLYIAAVVTTWCIAIFCLFHRMAHDGVLTPVMFWSYGVAIGPLAWLANHDKKAGHGDASLASVVFASVAYVAVILMALFGNPVLSHIILIFAVIMSIDVIANFVTIISEAQEMRSDR